TAESPRSVQIVVWAERVNAPECRVSETGRGMMAVPASPACARAEDAIAPISNPAQKNARTRSRMRREANAPAVDCRRPRRASCYSRLNRLIDGSRPTNVSSHTWRGRGGAGNDGRPRIAPGERRADRKAWPDRHSVIYRPPSGER